MYYMLYTMSSLYNNVSDMLFAPQYIMVHYIESDPCSPSTQVLCCLGGFTLFVIAGSPNESGFMVNKRAMYEPGAVMVCSQKRACCVVTMGFIGIIAVALIVAFTKPGAVQPYLKTLF